MIDAYIICKAAIAMAQEKSAAAWGLTANPATGEFPALTTFGALGGWLAYADQIARAEMNPDEGSDTNTAPAVLQYYLEQARDVLAAFSGIAVYGAGPPNAGPPEFLALAKLHADYPGTVPGMVAKDQPMTYAMAIKVLALAKLDPPFQWKAHAVDYYATTKNLWADTRHPAGGRARSAAEILFGPARKESPPALRWMVYLIAAGTVAALVWTGIRYLPPPKG